VTTSCKRKSYVNGILPNGLQSLDPTEIGTYCFFVKVKDVNPGDNSEEGYDELSTGYVIKDACNSEREKDKSASSRSCFCNTDDDLEASCFYNRKSNQQVRKE